MPYVISVIGTNHEQLLPHFFSHYASRGIKRFVFGVRGGQKNSAWKYLDDFFQYNITRRELELLPPDAINGIADADFMNATKCDSADWYVPADLDEFHDIPGLSFDAAVQQCINAGSDYVASQLVDRLAPGGTIPTKILGDVDIFEQFPEHKNITRDIMRACTDKVCLVRADLCVGPGHHKLKTPPTRPPTIRGQTFHFKWFGDLYTREQKKYAARKKSGVRWAKEQMFLFEHLQANNGRL